MLRNRAVALILGLAISPLVIALGLGPLQSDSFLNESFSGRIEIIGAKKADFDTLKVEMASLEQFKRAGIEFIPLLYSLKFAIDDSGEGDYIRVTSRDPIREPYLNFLVELNWANGRLLREYTVLLDPPLYDQRRKRVAAAAAPAATPVAAPAAPAAGPAPGAPAPTVRAGAYSAGGTIGPVVATDTLWSLAAAYRPDESVTVQQMMLALLRENPEAFGENNINLLRRGAVLRLPDQASLTAVSAAEAFAEAQRQHQLWEQYRQQVGAAPTSQPLGAAAPSVATDDAGTAAERDARLELIAPGGADSGGAPGSATGGGSDLLREEIEARAQQSAELESKLGEAEEIIDLLQRQVNIKDEELAALQARLAELGIEHGDLGTGDDGAGTMDDGGVAPAATDMPGDTAMETLEEAADEAVDTLAETADTATDMAEDVIDDAGTMVDEVVEDVAEEIDDGIDIEVAPPAARGFPDSLVPEQIAAMVPGGALTVLGAIAVVLLGLFGGIIGFLMKGRGERAAAAPAAAAVVADTTLDDTSEDATVAAATTPPADEDEDESEAETEIGEEDAAPAEEFDPNATVEAEADSEATTEVPAAAAAAPEEEEDPLEEINVYLAYERFEQAEELVKRVIGEYPERHEYKLRLLEVYYSANDRAAYETAARDLHAAVGEDDPLWDSAVAMWSEMSPERALFAEGGADAEAAPAQDEAKSFVDITGEEEGAAAPGEDTVARAPGDDDDGLDFDLSSEAAPAEDEGGDDVLDLTAAAGDDDVLDLTAAAGDDALPEPEPETGADAGDDVLDLTAAEDTDDVLDLTAGDDDGVLDLTADEEPAADDGDILDLTGGDGGDEIDLLSGSGGDLLGDADLLEGTGGDLLDVTKTGDIDSVTDTDLLNVTSPGLREAEEEAPAAPAADNADLEITDVTGESDEGLDFDISDTVAPAFETDGATTADDVLDLTGGEGTDEEPAAAAAEGDDLLDFDIGGLDDAGEAEPATPAGDFSENTTMIDEDSLEIDQDNIPTMDIGSALGSSADETSDELDFDITMGDEGGELDAAEGLGTEEVDEELEITMGSPAGEAPTDAEISLQGPELDELSLDGDTSGGDEFDLSLEGTSEMDSIAADDTLDMGSVDGGLDSADDTSLDDLSLQLDGAIEDAALDDLEIEGLESTTDGDTPDHLQTMTLDADDVEDEGDEKTVVMPVSDDIERQSDADEADTKLNLAKAYIELGDTEGARSILDDVAASGNEAQQTEAQALLAQLEG